MQIFFSIFWWIYFFIFFSGYPLLYGLLYLMSKNKKMHPAITGNIFPLLPVTYAFVSTCFWIIMLCTGKIDFVVTRILSGSPSSLIVFYSLSALMFWFPAFRKKLSLSLIHSLVLFLMPFANMLLKTIRHNVIPHDYISDLLRMYTAGLIIYIIAIIIVDITRWLFSKAVFLHHNKA